MMNDLSPGCDATLKTLAVSTGKISPGFSTSRKNYSVYVAHGIDSISVIPTANESGATLTVNGTAAASSQASGSISEEFVRAQHSYRAYADFNESGQKVRYRLVNSPGWLTVDSETGTIRGTPDTVGDATVTVEAYDDAGETARQTYTLHVLPVISTTS